MSEKSLIGFQGIQLFPSPLKQCTPTGAELDSHAELEGVEVGDHDLRAVYVVQHIAGDKFAAGVVAIGVVRLEDPKAVFDGETGRDDEETSREVFAAGAPHGVDRLPCDQHRHHGGLARARRQLQRETQKLGVGIFVGGGQVFEDLPATLRLGCDLD